MSMVEGFSVAETLCAVPSCSTTSTNSTSSGRSRSRAVGGGKNGRRRGSASGGVSSVEIGENQRAELVFRLLCSTLARCVYVPLLPPPPSPNPPPPCHLRHPYPRLCTYIAPPTHSPCFSYYSLLVVLIDRSTTPTTQTQDRRAVTPPPHPNAHSKRVPASTQHT